MKFINNSGYVVAFNVAKLSKEGVPVNKWVTVKAEEGKNILDTTDKAIIRAAKKQTQVNRMQHQLYGYLEVVGDENPDKEGEPTVDEKVPVGPTVKKNKK